MKKYFVTAVFLLLAFPLLAQSGGIAPSEGISNTWLMNDVENNNIFKGYSSIAGNPYLNRNFRLGELISKNKVKFANAPMRYNIYTDNIEYKSPKNRIYTLKYPTEGEAYKIGDTTFIYSPYYQRNKKLSMSYFQVLAKGPKVMGLVRYSVYIQPFQQAKPYTPAKPPRFSSKNIYYYVKIADAPAREVPTKKSFLKLFPDQKEPLIHFIKKEHIGIQKQQDFIKLINYCNNLLGKK